MLRLLFCTIFFCSQVLYGQQHVPLNFADSIASWMTDNKVPVVAVGIIEKGKTKLTKVYGAAENTLFNVASLTKPITTMTTLRLISKGEWKLDQPVFPFWIDPDIAGDSRNKKLTTRILLSHQSGFPNWRSSDSGQKLRFNFDPGTKYSYSGEGFEYLRHSLENNFHRNIQQLAKSNVFDVIGMKNTSYGWNEHLLISRFAVPNDTNGRPIPGEPKITVNAADWLITTIGDYTKFAQYVINGGGISKDLFQQMIEPQVIIRKRVYTEAMGLGWSVIKPLSSGEYLLMHTGHDEGQYSVIMVLPKSGRGLVILTNGENGKNVIFSIIKATIPVPGLIP